MGRYVLFYVVSMMILADLAKSTDTDNNLSLGTVTNLLTNLISMQIKDGKEAGGEGGKPGLGQIIPGDLISLFNGALANKQLELPSTGLNSSGLPVLSDVDVTKVIPLLTSVITANDGSGVKRTIKAGLDAFGDRLPKDMMPPGGKEMLVRTLDALPNSLFDIASIDLMGTVKSAVADAISNGALAGNVAAGTAAGAGAQSIGSFFENWTKELKAPRGKQK